MFQRVFAPIGITRDDLCRRKNSYRPHLLDGIPRREFGSGVSANVGAMARLGYLFMREGRWKDRDQAVAALRACVENGAGYGLMLLKHNQTFPFHFDGAADDPVFYAELRALTRPAPPPAESDARDYFPPPESAGGWRVLTAPEDIRTLGDMDPAKPESLGAWLLQSDRREFAAVVIRHGYIVLEVERGNSAKTDARRVASVSKAVCATVLAIASERSQHGLTPRKMTFNDRAFDFIPWAKPLSDPRKAQITVKQLLDHTSGMCPEATGAPNDGS